MSSVDSWIDQGETDQTDLKPKLQDRIGVDRRRKRADTRLWPRGIQSVERPMTLASASMTSSTRRNVSRTAPIVAVRWSPSREETDHRGDRGADRRATRGD